MLRKWILQNRSEQYRAIGDAYKAEGTNDLCRGSFHLVSGFCSQDPIIGAVKGWQGGSKIGDGLQKRAIGSDYQKLANQLQQEANQSKWWHLW
jgi:hypothetical protein